MDGQENGNYYLGLMVELTGVVPSLGGGFSVGYDRLSFLGPRIPSRFSTEKPRMWVAPHFENLPVGL